MSIITVELKQDLQVMGGIKFRKGDLFRTMTEKLKESHYDDCCYIGVRGLKIRIPAGMVKNLG